MPADVRIQVDGAGKKFGKDWIFRDVNMVFEPGESYAILGNNGSGKSTFLMSLSGFYALSKGNISYKSANLNIQDTEWYQHYSLISPLLELPEDFTLEEFLHLHFSLKPVKLSWSIDRVYEETGLYASRHKFLKHLSSGMRQRIKLAMAFVADVPVIFLDEPCTNLDKAGITWYRLLTQQATEQLIIVASNMEEEYSFCRKLVHMSDLKKKTG